MTLDWHQGEVIASVQGRRLTRTAAAANYSVPSNVSSITRTPTVASDTRMNAMGRYLCVCGRSYSQIQGLRRHQREKHEASLCLYCGVFEWSRRYRLKEHLMKQHPDVDIAAALAEVTRTRRRETGGTSHRGE
jgi:hypothetical protein